MKDKQYLIWLHERIVNVYKESELVDFLRKLRSIIAATPDEQETQNNGWNTNSLDELIRPHLTSEVTDSMKRLVKLKELKPVPDGTHTSCLPDGYVLINATPIELKIMEIYSTECFRLKPPTIIAECQ